MKVLIDVSDRQAEFSTEAKAVRDAAEVDNIEVLGVVWQVRDKDRMRMTEAILAAEVLNLPAETTVNWILADNSLRPTTAADLRQVLAAYSLRVQEVFAAYTTWRAGPKSRPFEI